MRVLTVKLKHLYPKRILIIAAFILSFLNEPCLFVWTFALCLIGLFCKNKKNVIDILILMQLRTLINPGIAVNYSGITATMKWITIFLLSFVLLKNRHEEHRSHLNGIFRCFFVFAIEIIITNFLFSSYPIVATFKVISYIIPFMAVLKGICDFCDINWIKRIVIPLGFVLIGSAILIPFPVGYLRNGHAFQGLFNHPNVYGVMLALFLAGFLYSSHRITVKEIVMSIIVVMLAILSESRTGIFACVFAIVLYLLSKEIRTKASNIIYLFAIGLTIIALLSLNDSIMSNIYFLLHKGGNESILFSRENQIEQNLNRFQSNPLFGRGFNVPYVQGVYSLKFSFDLVVENGNLLLSLLGDVGIVGLIMFFICYIRIFRIGWGNKIVLFVIPFIVAMGEQSFFSTNNFALIMYMYISVYFADGMLKNVNGRYS